MGIRNRRRLPNGEEFLVDREMRWAAWLGVAAGVVCTLISWSLLYGLLAALGVRLGIEAVTLDLVEVEILSGATT